MSVNYPTLLQVCRQAYSCYAHNLSKLQVDKALMSGNLVAQNTHTENLLLAKLPNADFQQLASDLEEVELPVRQVVCQPGAALPYAYFPTSSMLSSIVLLSDGTAVEAATIGKEGMAGIGLLINERDSPYRVIQQVAGKTLRIGAERLEIVLRESVAVRELLMRYTFTLLQQAGQNAACNLHHNVEARMSRWLLQTSDRAGRDEFHITQEFLSEMLGVSRQSINATAQTLQQSNLIDYQRGHVAIRDRSALQHAACECYQLFNETYSRYMRIPIPKPADND